MTTPLTKLIEDNKWRPIAEATDAEEYIIAGGDCSAIAVRDRGRWITGYHEEYGQEYAEFEVTHFRPLPDDKLALVAEELFKCLNALHNCEVRWNTAQEVDAFMDETLAKVTAIAEGADESQIRSDQSNCETI